jgi:hypothetical protein
MSFDLVSRGFGFYSSVIGMTLMLIGMMIGINQSTSSTSGLYGVIVIYLFSYCDMYQWFLRQIITS